MATSATVTSSDWIKGISLSIVASMIGGASKLAIRKSWLIEDETAVFDNECDDTDGGSEASTIDGLSILQNAMPMRRLFIGCKARLVRVTRIFSDGLAGAVLASWPLQRISASSTNTAIALRVSGMVGMTFLNPLCCVLAMSYASPSILSPFSGLTLVWIVVLSQPVIGERLHARQVVAVGLIVVGEVTVTISGDHTNDDRRGAQMCVDAHTGLRNGQSKSDDLAKDSALLLGVSGGSLTGMQNFLKDGLSLLKKSEGGNEEHSTLLPLFATLAILTAFGGLLLSTACMKRYDAAFVVFTSIMLAMHHSTFQHLESATNYAM